MKWLLSLSISCSLLFASWCLAIEHEKDVPRLAQAEISRRSALVEHIAGIQDGGDLQAAIAAAMQPPADDSYKWQFTLVVMRNCQWCELTRRDFDTDAKLKAWVDTKDYTKSWAHWQVVQIEDQSQTWRWKDFKPTAFPTLIVQPPVNGSWGDPHTIVFARQGYAKPAELDAAIRKAIQAYAAKAYPRRLAWEGKSTAEISGGIEQARGGERSGDWNPPVTPPAPLPSYPNYPTVPYPNAPQQIPPQQPDAGSLLGQLLSSLFGGAATANFLLLAILAWQVYRGFAKKEGIPLLIDDATAAQLVQLLQTLPKAAREQPTTPLNSSGRSA